MILTKVANFAFYFQVTQKIFLELKEVSAVVF